MNEKEKEFEERLNKLEQQVNVWKSEMQKELQNKVDLETFLKLNNEVIELKVEHKKYFEEIIKNQKENKQETKQIYEETIKFQRSELSNREKIILKFASIGIAAGVVLALGQNADKVLKLFGF